MILHWHPEVLWGYFVAQLVKDLALSLQWLRSLLWCVFDSCPGNFHMLWAQPKKKKKTKPQDPHPKHERSSLYEVVSLCCGCSGIIINIRYRNLNKVYLSLSFKLIFAFICIRKSCRISMMVPHIQETIKGM